MSKTMNYNFKCFILIFTLPLTVGGITCGMWVLLVEFASTINTSWGGSNDISRVISAKLILDVSCWGLL